MASDRLRKKKDALTGTILLNRTFLPIEKPDLRLHILVYACKDSNQQFRILFRING